MDMISQIQPWHWFVLATVLFVLEISATVGFFIGIAIAALILSVLTYFMPDISWEVQLISFGALSLVLTVAYKKYFGGFNDATDSPLLNDRAAQMVGTTLQLEEDLNSRGALMIHDTRWQVECEGELSAGTRVVVKGSRGMTLLLQAQ